MALERLQKIISRSGLASRRKAEEWIVEGKVSVNGVPVRELGSKADLSTDQIRVSGKPLVLTRNLVYLALHKPRGCVTTRSDPQGRPTVMDFVKGIKERVYPVGRLDYHTSGLLLLTNDGEFANLITSAAEGVPKTYWVKCAGLPKEQDLEKLRAGIVLDRRRTRPARIRAISHRGREVAAKGRRSEKERGGADNPWFEVTLWEGRQNQIRRMFERIGHPVRKLHRVQIGNLSLGKLPVGQYRPLTPAEVKTLFREGKKNERSAKDDH